MHSKLLAVALATSFACVSLAVEAMPAAPVAGATATPQVTLVAEGCGPGFAVGPGGACRRIRRAPVVVVAPRRRPAVVVRGGCGGVRVGPVAVRGC
jgi:hypothetical protein